jgi:catechol 2,3-dioxygenase-like lactoylglutathione lyase family enzyme
MLVKRIHHVAVIVADVEKSQEFYSSVFGLEPIKRLTATISKNRGAWFKLADQELHLQEREGHIDKTEQHLAFLTENFEEVVSRVKTHGGRYQEAKLTEGFSKRCFVYDIDDNRIELLQA